MQTQWISGEQEQVRLKATAEVDGVVEDGGGEGGAIARLWVGYGTAVAAGLMVIGHATGIVMDKGGDASWMVTGAMMIGAGNALGGIVAGVVVDRVPARMILVALPALSSVTLVALLSSTDARLVIWLLAITGVCYGAIIAVYPAAVVALFGMRLSARVYGRVFTAWGFAGLVLPWLAGMLFDRTGSYDLPVVVAAGLGIASAVAAFGLPNRSVLPAGHE